MPLTVRVFSKKLLMVVNRGLVVVDKADIIDEAVGADSHRMWRKQRRCLGARGSWGVSEWRVPLYTFIEPLAYSGASGLRDDGPILTNYGLR